MWIVKFNCFLIFPPILVDHPACFAQKVGLWAVGATTGIDKWRRTACQLEWFQSHYILTVCMWQWLTLLITFILKIISTNLNLPNEILKSRFECDWRCSPLLNVLAGCWWNFGGMIVVMEQEPFLINNSMMQGNNLMWKLFLTWWKLPLI